MMIKYLANKYNFFRKNIYNIQRMFFLDKVDKIEKFKKPKKQAISPPNPPTKPIEKKIILNEQGQNKISKLSAGNSIEHDFTQLPAHEFELFIEFNKRRHKVRESMGKDKYDTNISKDSKDYTEEFSSVEGDINRLGLQSQLRDNILRMGINNLDLFSKSMFNLLIRDNNNFIKSNESLTSEKIISFLLPIIQKILSKNENVKQVENSICPYAIIIINERYSIPEIEQIARLLCDKTGIKISNLSEENIKLKGFNLGKILIASSDGIMESIEKKSFDASYIDRTVFLNTNNIINKDNNFLRYFYNLTKSKSKYTVFYTMNSVELIGFKDSFNDYFLLNYTIQDNLKEKNLNEETRKENLNKKFDNDRFLKGLVKSIKTNKFKEEIFNDDNLKNILGIKHPKRNEKYSSSDKNSNYDKTSNERIKEEKIQSKNISSDNNDKEHANQSSSDKNSNYYKTSNERIKEENIQSKNIISDNADKEHASQSKSEDQKSVKKSQVPNSNEKLNQVLIKHLAIQYSVEKSEEMFQKIKKLLNFEGFKIIQIYEIKNYNNFLEYLIDNDINFLELDDIKDPKIVIESQILVLQDINSISRDLVKMATLIININLPGEVKDFFSLVGKYGEKVGSTITFIDNHSKKENLNLFVECLKEYNQKIPNFLLN